jgi:RNA polymerase sigma-70 factor (ECF subfamily)
MAEDRQNAGPAVPAVDIADLVSRYHRLLYGYAYRLTGSVADAEDLVQQTFLIAQEKCHQIRRCESARSWLFTVLRNCYLKARRRRVPELAEDIQLPLDQLADAIPEDLWIDRELLQRSINELPDPFKIVLLLFYFEQYSYREIAEELDVPPGTVMSRLSRAKHHLRTKLLGYGQTTALSGPAESNDN